MKTAKYYIIGDRSPFGDNIGWIRTAGNKIKAFIKLHYIIGFIYPAGYGVILKGSDELRDLLKKNPDWKFISGKGSILKNKYHADKYKSKRNSK